MSHKYYGFQKENENNVYNIPFLSTKTSRLRFLNDDFVGYGEKNELIIHKNPGFTICRLTDDSINQRFHNLTNTNKLMNEFLNHLINNSQNTLTTPTINKNLNIKQIGFNSRSAIRITLHS